MGSQFVCNGDQIDNKMTTCECESTSQNTLSPTCQAQTSCRTGGHICDPPSAKTKLVSQAEDKWTGRGPRSKTWFRGELYDIDGSRAQTVVSTGTSTLPVDTNTEL